LPAMPVGTMHSPNNCKNRPSRYRIASSSSDS
jgi:hypothetical protein